MIYHGRIRDKKDRLNKEKWCCLVVYHKNPLNIGKPTIHGSYGFDLMGQTHFRNVSIFSLVLLLTRFGSLSFSFLRWNICIHQHANMKNTETKLETPSLSPSAIPLQYIVNKEHIHIFIQTWTTLGAFQISKIPVCSANRGDDISQTMMDVIIS